MNDPRHSWRSLEQGSRHASVDGLIPVTGYVRKGRPPEEVAVMEKAAAYNADFVFFEAGQNGKQSTAQALVYISNGQEDDPDFAKLHRQLWSWGGVPLIYRKLPGLVQLFRCAHKPDFISATGEIVCNPIRKLKLAADITSASSNDPWWDTERLCNGTLWQDPKACETLLSDKKTAHKGLIDAVQQLNRELNDKGVLPVALRRKLLILSLLIAYLEQREVFVDGYFAKFSSNATKFFEVLSDGSGLVSLLEDLERRFNGNVFTLEPTERELLRNSQQLTRFARLIEGRDEKGGQRSLWQLYSFKDLPVELISHIYQIFVQNADSSVYTPHFLVRLMLGEALSWKRLDRLEKNEEVILDPSCGSGVFLVEAYKRVVLHWRSRNDWKRPGVSVLKALLNRIHGVDLEQGAVELAAFSLCLALCDALEPADIRDSIRLFPALAGKTLHHSCFFAAQEAGLIKAKIGVMVGNPPFDSNLTTDGAKKSYARYQTEHPNTPLPDKQLAYLFLHEAMQMVVKGGALCLLQQYNFLYNQQSLGFRRKFIETWDVREILDFTSVRGLFQKGGADTKVIVVVAEASPPPPARRILHATFRRSGRLSAGQGSDIDYYDLHWLPRDLALGNDGVWRADLLGGGRVLAFVDRLKKFRTLGQYADMQKWDYGEGFIEGSQGVDRTAEHIIGKRLLPSEALTLEGIDTAQIIIAPDKPIEGPRSEKRFTPPMLLVREQMDLPHALWNKHYLTYKNKIVGFAAPREHNQSLINVSQWLESQSYAMRAYVAGISVRLFTQKATTLSGADIIALPYPESGTLNLSANEQILVDDIVDYHRDFIRLGEDSRAMQESGHSALTGFSEVFTGQINTVYKKNPLRSLAAQAWPGVICQPFVFGKGTVDWTDAHALRGKLTALLREQKCGALCVTRIARIYDGRFLFVLKPDRLRYWLKSVALRDADETLADLRQQGF